MTSVLKITLQTKVIQFHFQLYKNNDLEHNVDTIELHRNRFIRI